MKRVSCQILIEITTMTYIRSSIVKLRKVNILIYLHGLVLPSD